jgi:hypothetical protein
MLEALSMSFPIGLASEADVDISIARSAIPRSTDILIKDSEKD